MFVVGASRALIANVRWWTAGLEMLGLGAVVAALAYGSGALVAAVVAGLLSRSLRKGPSNRDGLPGDGHLRSSA
jgi:hypothetical protein